MATKRVLSPSLLVGVGGTGSLIAQNVYGRAARAGLVAEGRVRVLSFDTDENDMRRLGGLGPDQRIRYSDARSVDDLLDRYPDVERNWFVHPRSDLPMELRKMTLLDGAAQIRMLSRLALHDAYARGQIETTLGAAIAALGQHDNRGGFEGQVNVLMVGSLAGATGSGSFLQIAMMINEVAQKRNVETKVFGLFLMPDVYVRSGALPQGQIPNVLANGYAGLKEFSAVTLKSTERQGRFDFSFEFAPGRMLSPGDIPFSSLSLIDFEDMRGGSLGRSIPAYRRLAERAAFTLLFTPIGGKADSVLVNDVRDIAAAAARGTHNRIAAIGLSAMVYPHEGIVDYLRDRFALEILSGDWLRLDRQFEARLRRFRNLRAAGNMTAPEPQQGPSYIEDLRQLALDEQIPFFREIHERLNPAVVEQGETTIVPLHDTFLAAFDAHLIRTFWNGEDLKDIAGRRPSDADQFASDKALAEEVRLRENRLDGDLRAVEAALVNRPNDLVVNLFSVADDLSSGELRDHHLQRFLLDRGPHLVQSRAFLFALRLVLEARLASMSSDEIRKRLFRLANAFDKERKPESETRGSPLILREAGEIARRGLMGRMLKGGKDDFVERYVTYYNGSLKATRDYAETRLREKAYRLLLAEVEEVLRVTNGLFKEIEGLLEQLQAQVADSETRHQRSNIAENVLNVCSDKACKTSLWAELQTAMTGQRLGADVNQTLTHDLYRLARRNRIKLDPEGLKTLRRIFTQTVVEGFSRQRVVDDYASLHDLSVVQAVRKQAEIEKVDAAGLFRELFSIVDRQSEVLVTLSSPLNGQNIRFWALHPDLREQMAAVANPDQLINPSGQGVQTVEEPEFSIREIMSVSLQVNLELTHLAKLSPPYRGDGSAAPDRAGRYYQEYQTMVDELIVAASEKRTPWTITPHIHRDWHKPGLLPEISDAETRRLVGNINKGFAIGLALDALKLTVSHGIRIAELRTVGRVATGAVAVEIAESHDLYTVLHAFERRPEAVRGCLKLWESERRRLEGLEPEAQNPVLSPEILTRILMMAESRNDGARRDERVAEVVAGYAQLVEDYIASTQPNVPRDIQWRQTDDRLRATGQEAMAALEARGVSAEARKVMEACFAYGLERWRAGRRTAA